MKFERSHLFFGCDIMNYFIFSLFLLLLFDSSQGSTASHRRSIRALNTTLETDFDGTYERRNPCTNAEVEKSSYKASHEFRHYSKESNWSEYSRKCTAIISGFLQAIGNLVRFNNEQKGIFNFHINTSISQKQDRHSDLCHEQSCPSLPTIIIEATDGDVPQNAALKNVPLERPSVKQSNCSITGYSENGVSEIRQRVCPNQRKESTCKLTPVNSLEKEPADSTFYPTGPESQPESTSIYYQDTTDTNQRPPVRQRQAILNQDENIASPDVPQIPSSPVLVPFPRIAQSEVISPAAFTRTQKCAPQPDFYGTPTRPEYSSENYDANIVTPQPRNEIRIPNIEPSLTKTLDLENQFQPGPAYVEKSYDFNSSPVPSTTYGQFNEGPTVNIPGTAENVPVYQSDEPRATTGEDQLLGQQPTNVIPEQPLSDSLGGQESNSRPLVTPFTPPNQFPTTVLFPEDRFNPSNRVTEFGRPTSYPNQISPVSDEPQSLPSRNVEDVKTFEQEITPKSNPPPELADLPRTETPSVPEPVGISQPNFLPNAANSFFLPPPNSVQTVRLNPPSPALIPPPQQLQNNLLNTNPQFVPENQATTPDQFMTVNSEYDELSDQRLVTQLPQGEDTFSNTEAKSDDVPSPFIQSSPVQLGIPGEAPAMIPYNSLPDSPTFTPQSDISNGQPSIIGQPLNDNQASGPTSFAPGQSSDNEYNPSSLLPEGRGDFSFEAQRATPSYDSEPILNNTPIENTAEEIPGNPEYISPTVPDAVIPTNNQFGYPDPAFNPTQETTSYNVPAIQATVGPEVQPPQSFPSIPVGSQLQSSPNYSQSQPSTSTTYINETITTDTISKEPFDQFVSTFPTEQPPVGIYGAEQPQFTTVGPYEEPQIQATVVPQLGLGDEYAKNEMAGSPASDFNRQQTPSFVQPSFQTEENAPFSQFPSNNSPEQQPMGNYNMIQSQTTSGDSFEDSQPRTTDAPVFSVDNRDGITTSSPDLYNQQTPNIIQSDLQVGDNSPLAQFPPNLPLQQQPVGNYEAPDPQIMASVPSENLQLQANDGPKFLPPVEPASTFYDQQNPITFLPTQSPIETNEPFEQLPTTASPGQQFTENSETEVESSDDPQRQNMGSEFQFPLQNANGKMPGLVLYGRQIPMRFLPSESQLLGKAPLGQFPTTQFTEQAPEGNSEFTQSEPFPAAAYEDPKTQTPMGPESQLASVNSEDGTARLPDPVSYNLESPNTFTQPDSQLARSAPFNQFPSKEVQIESTITQSETIVPSRDNDNQLSQLPALEDVNQETPVVPESQQPVGNDQMAQQSTPAQIYEDSGMQTTIGAEVQPVPEYEGGVPNSFVQPDSQFGGSPLSNQFPGNLPPEQSLIGDSEMNQGQATSPDPYAVPQPQTIAQPESLPSQEYGNDRMNGLPAVASQQYPSSIIPNTQVIDSTGFPATFSPEQQPVGNYDLTQPQLTSASANGNENTVPQFPATEELQPSQGYTDQYLNNGKSEVPAFGVINQQIPVTLSETESGVSSDASFGRFPSTFSPEPQWTSGLSYGDPQMQGTVRPDFQSPPEYTDGRVNVSPVPNNEQNASTSIPSDSQLQDGQLFNPIQPEPQLENNEPSTITPEEQLSENEQISQSTPVSVAASEDSRLQATTASEPQTPFLYSETTGLPNFNFNNQQTPAGFVPIESQVINNIPFDQFPATFPQRQQPLGIYETEQSQLTTVTSKEEYQEQATAAPQTESVTQYSNAQPTGLPDQQAPDVFVQPVPPVKDNSPFSQFPSTLPPEEQPIGNYEISQPLNSTAGTYQDQTIATEFQTTATPKWQPFENYANDRRAGLPIPGFITPQIPNTFVSGIPTNTGFRRPPAAQQENQAEESSEVEDPTSPTLAAQPETFTPEISSEQASSANIQPTVSQNDFQGAMNPTLAESDLNSSFTPQTQFEDPSFTSYQTEPQFNNQRDLISNTETLPNVPVPTLAAGKESFGNPEQTFKTSPLDMNTSIGNEDQSMPSSAFVSPYQGQALNDDMTRTIPNIPALNSEQAAPVMDADSPANIYVSNPRETVNPTGEYGNSLYPNAGNPSFVNPNLPYGYTPTVKPYFRDEQYQITTSTNPSVSSRDQFPANNYPSGSDPVFNQNPNGNSDQSQPESGMSEQTSNVYPPNAPLEYGPPQPAQFPDVGQSVPQETPAADQPNTDSSTVSSTSDTSFYAPQSTYINSQPIPFMPEMSPEAVSPLPNEYGRPIIADLNVGDDSSRIQRKFSPRPILLYGNGNPSLADPETTLSPSITTYSDNDFESQSEQFSPERSSTFTPPNQKPSDFENPVTELQSPNKMQPSDSMISAPPEPTVLKEQATPDSLPEENQNLSQQDVNQYSGYPNQLYTGPLNPIAFKIPNMYTQFPPQPFNPSFQEGQNLQRPFNSNPIPSQAPNSEEQVVPALPQNENQPSFTPVETSEPQWKVPENPQPVDQLYQTEEVKDTLSSQQPSTVSPMFYQPGNDTQPGIPYQPPIASEQLPNFEATEFPSEQQGSPLNNFNTPISSADYQGTVTSPQATQTPEDLNQMSPFSTVKPFSAQQMTPYSNDWDPSADSVVTAHPTSAETLSESDNNVIFSAAQPRSELESQSLISTAGNDQPLPGTFQPSYAPESQTETTLPYSNDPSVGFTPSFADSENPPLSSAPFNEVQSSTEFEDTSTSYNPPSVTLGNPPASDPSNFVTVAPPAFQSKPEKVDDSLVLQPVSAFNQFPPAVSPNPTVLMFPQAPAYGENPLATTDYTPPSSDSSSLSETSAESYTVNPNAFDPRDETRTQETEGYQPPAPISGSNIPLNNAEQSPIAVVEATPSPEPQFSSPDYGETLQPTLNSWNAPEVMPEPQPQPSLDHATEIQDYKTEDGTGQTSTTFYNTSPLQLNPETFRTSGPNPTNTFQPERQTPFAYNPDRMNTNGDYPLPDTPTPQSFGEESSANLNAPTTAVTYSSDDIYTTDNVRRNPEQNTGLQTDYGTTPPNQAFAALPVEAPVMYNIPLRGQYEPQPNQAAPELTDNVSPQIQSTTMNYDGETNTYQSSPAPQPQTTLNNMDQLSDDNIASISPDELENASPTFQSTPAFISQTTNPEFPNRDTQFQQAPQSQLTEENPVISDDQQPPSTVFEPSTITETVKSDISFSNQANEGVPIQLGPEISPNPPEILNQAVEQESSDYAEPKLGSGKTDYPDDFTPSSPPFEKPLQTEVPVTEYDIITEEISNFPPNYQPQLFDNQAQPADTQMYNEQLTDPQENIATEFSGVTNPSPETQLTNTDNINNNDELEPIPGGTTFPPQDSSTIIAESSSYSDSSVYNVRRRPNGRLFDISSLPQSEGNNDKQVEYSPALVPNNSEQPLVLDPTTPVDYDLSTQSPEAAVTQYDEGTQGNQNNVPEMRQPFDYPTEQPGLYNSQLGVPVQPQTDSPLDFEEESTRRPATFTPNSESFAFPSPPKQEEPHFNPLFQTLESHLIVPLPEPQQLSTASSSSLQEPLYLDPREASPIPNDSFSFDQSNQNRFSTIPPNFRRPDFDQNFVTSQPQPNAGDVMNTPQSDSQALVSDLTTPSNKPGEDCVSCSYKGSYPIMCPFDPVLKGNMTAPSYYILISKLPAQDNQEEDFRVEKVYLGDGTPLNCSLSAGKTFPTSLYTPVQLRSTGTVKLRTKRSS